MQAEKILSRAWTVLVKITDVMQADGMFKPGAVIDKRKAAYDEAHRLAAKAVGRAERIIDAIAVAEKVTSAAEKAEQIASKIV